MTLINSLSALLLCYSWHSWHLLLQEFPGAERIVQDVEAAGVTVRELQQRRIVQDDRVEFTVTDSAILFGSRSRGNGW